MDFVWYGMGIGLTSVIYAAIIECNRKYWVKWSIAALPFFVIIGVSYVGVWMYYFTLYGNVPTDLTGREAMMWINWHWVYAFLWGGIPMTLERIFVALYYFATVSQASEEVLIKAANDLRTRDKDV